MGTRQPLAGTLFTDPGTRFARSKAKVKCRQAIQKTISGFPKTTLVKTTRE